MAHDSPDAISKQETQNKCCAELKKQLLVGSQKRKVLRQALDILEKEFKKLESENAQLKKFIEEGKLHTQQEKEAKEKEIKVRVSLEKEVHALNKKVSTFQKKESSRNTEEHNELVSRISAQDAEIKRLEILLMKEKKSGDSDKKSVELEKKKTAEVRKLLEIEKSKVEEARKLADTERMKAEGLALSFDRLKTELNQVRDELIKERSKVHDIEITINKEKQKGTRKRKHAEIELAKAEERSKVLNLERKKMMDKKMQVDYLRQQLDDEKQKREEYERKLLATIHAQGVAVSADKRFKVDSGNNAQLKLLKEQLKLVKEQVKHFKRKARLEKSEKLHIRQLFDIQELNTLKLSHHLKFLGDQLSQSIENTVSLEKVQSSYSLGLNSQMMNFGLGPSQADILLTNSCNSSGSKRKCSCYNLSGRNYIRQFHSTKSDLQSLTKDSVRSKQPNSAVCSATTMLSNGKILDPQGGNATLVASSSKFQESLLKQKPKKTRYSHEAGKDINDDRIISKANKRCKNIFSESIENENPKTLSCQGKKVSCQGKKVSCQGKKVSCQGNKVSSQEFDEGNIRMTDNHLERVDGKFNRISLEKGEIRLQHKDGITSKGSMRMKSPSKSFGSSQFYDKKRDLRTEMHNDDGIRHAKIFRTEEDNLQTLDSNYNTENRNLKLGSKSSLLSSSFNSMLFNDHMSKDLPICREGTLDSFNAQWLDLVKFENMILGDCLKLLELDNSGDEKRFNEAVERPLSPTLARIPEEHDNDILYEKREIGETIVKPCQAYDTIDPKICSNRLETEVPLPSKQISNDCYGSSYASEEANCRDVSTFQEDADKFMVVEKISASTNKHVFNLQAESSFECLVDSCNHHMLERSNNVVAKENENTLLPCVDLSGTKKKIGSNVLDFATHDGHELLHSKSKRFSDLEGSFVRSEETPEAIVCSTSHHLENIDDLSFGSHSIMKEAPKHFFLGPDTKDEDSMSRIIQASKMLAVGKLDQCQTDCFLSKLLDGLSLEVHLQHKEKISVVLSLLLWNLSSKISTCPSRLKTGDILLISRSFAAQMNKVIADEATRLLFLDVCPIDILLDLIEEFLIKRSILMCNDKSELTCSSVSTVAAYHLKELNMFLIETTAKVDQLIAASMMLASFCFVFSEIDFLLGASYKILQIHKSDVSFNLLALHVFQSVCGEEFCAAANCKCYLAAIKSMVCYLENEYSSYPRSTSNIAVHFEPCVQCPFSNDAIGIEEFLSLLLSMLEESSLSGNSMFSTSECVHAKEKRTYQSSNHGNLGSTCDASCLLFKYSKHGDSTSVFTPQRIFCWFTDVVSIVELFSHYMSWSWMHDNVLPRLLKIISSCPLDDCTASIVLLVGQMGRVGIDFGGYDQIGIKELLCTLSDYLDGSMRRKSSLSKQLATVDAMVNLLPVRFREIVHRYHERSVDSKHSPQIKIVKEWYSCLSNRQQFLVLDLFKDESQ